MQPHTSQGISQRTVAGLLWSFAGTASQALLQLAVLTVLARLIDPVEFGLIGAALVVISFADLFAKLGVGQALVQRDTIEPSHVNAALVLSLGVGAVFTVAIVLAAGPVAEFFSMPRLVPVLRVLAMAFLINGIAVVSRAVLQRQMRFRDLAHIQVVSYSVSYGVIGVGLALGGFGAWALAGAYMSQAVMRAALSFWKAPHGVGFTISKQAYREILAFGGGFTLGNLANYAALQGDNVIVGRTLGAAALGIYGRAYQLMVMPVVLLGQVLDSVLFPAMAEVKADPDKLRRAYIRAMTALAAFLAPISAAVAVLAPEVIRLALGPAWSMAEAPLRVLALGMVFRMEYKISDALAHASGTVYRRAWRQGVYAVLVIGGAYVGQQQAGLTGVALAVLAAIVAVHLLMLRLSMKTINLGIGDVLGAHIPAFLAFVLVGAGVWVLAAFLRDLSANYVVILLTAGAYTGSVSLALFWAMPNSAAMRDIRWIVQRVSDRVWKRDARERRMHEPQATTPMHDGTLRH